MMIKDIFKIVILFYIFILQSSISYATSVSGDVCGVWTSEDNPYEVVGDLHVPQCSTLVIEPGCYINFLGWYEFKIDSLACLIANGSENDSIYFTAEDTLAGWSGLRFYYTGNTSSLAFCNISRGKGDENTPDGNAGAIDLFFSALSISNCVLKFNDASEGKGGAIYSKYSDISINNSKFQSNHSGFGGAVLWCENSTVQISNSTFDNNISFYPLGGELAGAIGCYSSDISVCDNVFSQNGSGMQGGAILVAHSTALINNNEFSGNWAWSVGAALHIANTKLTMLNNLIINNFDCRKGSGLYFGSDSSTIIANNIFYGNYALQGGAIYGQFSDNDTLINNIIWNNTAVEGNNIYLTNSDSSHIFYSCIEGGWPGEGNIDLDPMFDDPDHLAFNLRWDNYPLEDSTKSPCIDAGAPWSPLDPDSTRADMGAFFFDQWLNDIDEPDHPLPRHIMLHQNYPNPFNASTLISYELPTQSQVRIDIYDILGRQISTLEDGLKQAGHHRIAWNATDLPSGIYFYKLQAGDYKETNKMILAK